MPPLRTGRASKACDLCRRHKTRCYASDNPQDPCLRCKTLSQACSLRVSYVGSPCTHVAATPLAEHHDTTNSIINRNQPDTTNERLERLERTVKALVERLDSKFAGQEQSSDFQLPRSPQPLSLPESDSAPVLLIRDAATSAGVASPEQILSHHESQQDVISSGLIPQGFVHTLLSLFHLHYGRWVRFPEDISTDALLLRVRKSPLLLCSIFLIAVRHSNHHSASIIAPKLFHESKQLITNSLLEVPQNIEFFQAVLILSLWSTTVGQVPLSIDSWLLTGYAIQQALASPCFGEILKADINAPIDASRLDSWCVWNHICVAHLQYCVGTRRQALLSQAQIDHCTNLLRSSQVTNYETRMVAEVKLYWIIYSACGGSRIDLSETKSALQTWQRQWASLFNEPRSQFLQMGYCFAHLLVHCQWLKSPQSTMHHSILKEVVYYCQSIIKLAIDTADERTRHLTDHIYHVVTFSALTLCRIVHTYESKLQAARYDVSELDNLVSSLISWLSSIGSPNHAARILGKIVSTQFQKLRPNYQPTPSSTWNLPAESPLTYAGDDLAFPSDVPFLYPSFISSELFEGDIGANSWPDWGRSQSDSDMPI